MPAQGAGIHDFARYDFQIVDSRAEPGHDAAGIP
jgi:hypothetical protein